MILGSPYQTILTLTTSAFHYPPFALISQRAVPHQPHLSLQLRTSPTGAEDKDQDMYSRDRDRLSIDTFTIGLDRDALFSRKNDVANLLKHLGPAVEDREEGISSICDYIEGKRSKGKNDEEIRRKLGILEAMVPAGLGDVFVNASLRSGLALKITQCPPFPIRPVHRARISLSSMMTSSSSSSRHSLVPVPVLSSAILESHPCSALSDSSEEPSAANSLSPTSNYPSSSSPSSSCFCRNSPDHGISPLPPLTSDPDSPSTPLTYPSTSSLGRAPTLLSPLALGGWGRQWERSFLFRTKPQSDGNRINLERFPIPPEHTPSPSIPSPDRNSDVNSSCSIPPSSSASWIENKERPKRSVYVHALTKGKQVPLLGIDVNISQPRSSYFIAGDISPIDPDPGYGVSPTKSGMTERTLDQSWLSISDDSMNLPSSSFASVSDDSENRWEWEDPRALDDEQKTVTGVESSRWSAIWSDMSSTEMPDQGISHLPTEASMIRDAYLNMIQPSKLSNMPGPEQGDSQTLLMAYA
ncbi:uncharacterized protein IL334_001645 [Kwoniella shivajii]|uniref:Uncharacterized protein n=1 Tax=Kwoniella shivajii TaxID=564305 RepID=A0ABZ1CSR6_9TREE|nr:hypothetical protein IL334_001645 [Kwoniella shivajii]